MPISFTYVTGTNKNLYEANGAKMFNKSDNSEGHFIKILICSPVVKEGYEFKDVAWMIIYNYNKPLPWLIQLIGRVVWLDSHLNAKNKHCIYNIFLNEDAKHSELMSFQESVDDYLAIQEYDKIMFNLSLSWFVPKQQYLYEEITHSFDDFVPINDSNIDDTQFYFQDNYKYYFLGIQQLINIYWEKSDVFYIPQLLSEIKQSDFIINMKFITIDELIYVIS